MSCDFCVCNRSLHSSIIAEIKVIENDLYKEEKIRFIERRHRYLDSKQKPHTTW